MACAYLSVLTTFGIVFVLIFETINFFREVSVVEFLTSTKWSPAFTDPEFGVIVLICGTLLTTAVAIAFAVPVGLLAAIFLSEYASLRLRRWLKPALEVLAGVPTVVYGYFALTFVTPFLQNTILPSLQIFNALSAGLVMGVMIIPTVASVSEDAIYAVPRSLREGAYALGATKREVATRIVVPAALSGIVASVILGISRAATSRPRSSGRSRVVCRGTCGVILGPVCGSAPHLAIPGISLERPLEALKSDG